MIGRKLALFATIVSAWSVSASAQPPTRDAFVVQRDTVAPQIVARLRQEHAAASVAIVKVDTDLLRTAPVNSTVRLALSPTLSFDGVTRQTADLGEGRRLWKGDIPATATLPQGDATLVVNGADITGTVVAPNGDRYQVRPVGGGLNAVIKLDYAKLPKDEPDSAPPQVRSPESQDSAPPAGAAMSTAAAAGDGATADATPTIDVLVAYTPSASTASGGIDALIDLAIQESNTAFTNSGVNARFRLAGKMALSYTEAGKTFDTILSDFAGNASVAAQRNSVGADVSVLIINQSDFCGQADDIGATAATAYVIVHYSCATGYYSFAHEIGHLAGARHDRDHDSTNTPFSYGHAHLEKKSSGGWRTIMGYACGDGSCPTRIQYWSSPAHTYAGATTGAANEDNARVWNERAATVAAFRAPPSTGTAYAGRVFQLHNTGRIWRSTGVSCGSAGCPGWQMLDNNPATKAIVASAAQLYQIHSTGRIWRFTGQACNGNSCPGWQMLDNNPAGTAIAAAGSSLYQLHNTGRIWRSTGVPCTGNSCPGWQMLDNNPATKAIAAAANNLYQLHNTGRIWRFLGQPCNGNSCPSWQMLDNNPAAKAIAASGSALYQLHNTGKIWRSTGQPCNGNSCPGWQMLDNNPATIAIFANGNGLYQLHNTGKIWRFTGQPCNGNSCPGWQMLDNNPATVALAGDGANLFQLHNTGKIWRFQGAPCNGNSCPSWLQIDNNPATKAIVGAKQ